MLNELSSIWKRTYLDWESLTETLSYFSAVAKYSYREDDNEILEEFLQKFASPVIPHLIFDLKNLTAIGHSDLLLSFAGNSSWPLPLSLSVTSTT
ncbi:hypothetical protein, partial [Shewanella sp. Sh95]|uniref:hypothetical protein n=1 Tax=Shewanella sp. Sh95 TaxID=1689868 RepID=UPI001E5C18DB